MINSSRSVRGYYHRPLLWVGSAPPDLDGDLDPRTADELMQQWEFECGLRLGVQRQGLFLFDFGNCTSSLFSNEFAIGDSFARGAAMERRRLELMSAHALLLHSGVLQHDGLTLPKYRPQLTSLVVTESVDNGGMGIGTELALTSLIMTPYRDSYRAGVLRQHDPRLFFRSTVSLAATNEASIRLERLLRGDDAELLLEAVYLLNEAAAFAEEHHYSLALTIAWTVCERLLNWRWTRFLDAHKRRPDGSGTVDKPRRRRLSDNRTYSSAVKAEILCFDGAIELSLYERLSALRKLRNEWIHGSDKYEVSTSDASTAIAVVNEMLKALLAFDFPVNLALSLHG